jgi:hypothetical protein
LSFSVFSFSFSRKWLKFLKCIVNCRKIIK